MIRLRAIVPILGAVVLLAVAGCATPATNNTERYYWPPPPNPPRIEWLAAYHSQLDLAKTPMRRFKEAIVGEDAPVSLVKPVEARMDADHDKLYVADIGAAAIFVFDLKQNALRILSLEGAKLSGKIRPIGLALDSDNNLYALEPHLNQILVFDAAERYRRTIKLAQICRRPAALAIDKSRKRLYISDIQLDKIFALDLDGRLLFTVGKPGDTDGTLNRPIGMTVNARGELLVADAFNATVQVFDDQGQFRRSFGRRGDAPGDFQLIKAVAVDSDDDVYVVDGRSNNIKIFNQSGDLLLTFGNYYAVSTSGKLAPGGFAVPIGIDIDSHNRIFIVDQLNARIQVFQYLSSTSGTSSLPNPQQAK